MKNFSDLKYLLSFTIPTAAIVGVSMGGYFTWLGVVYAFGVIPLMELLFKGSQEATEEKNGDKIGLFYDILLYLNLPLVIFSAWFALSKISIEPIGLFSLLGIIFSTGIVFGTSGINVAHELGHRSDFISQTFAKLLLLPSLYCHFTIEHNRGHHLYVATPEDPSTARYNEPVFIFWVRSTVLCYINAWRLESKSLSKEPFINKILKNEMLLNTVICIAYIIVVKLFFGNLPMWCSIAMAIVSFLLLETINYIEHYGLLRVKQQNGRYELTTQKHSWNSEHQLGRIMLYELTRHSDHHYKANKQYQTLEYYDDSPQLPYGYPASMLISLVPPLWFKLMNNRVPRS